MLKAYPLSTLHFQRLFFFFLQCLTSVLQTMSIPTLFESTDVSQPDILESAHNLNQDILGGTMLVVGLFATFFGAKYFKHMIFFIGFIIGGFLAYFATPTIYSWFGSTVKDDTLLYISLVFLMERHRMRSIYIFQWRQSTNWWAMKFQWLCCWMRAVIADWLTMHRNCLLSTL